MGCVVSRLCSSELGFYWRLTPTWSAYGKGSGAENAVSSLFFSVAVCLPCEGPSLPAVKLWKLITSATCKTLSALVQPVRTRLMSLQCCFVQALPTGEEGTRTSYWPGGPEKMLCEFIQQNKQRINQIKLSSERPSDFKMWFSLVFFWYLSMACTTSWLCCTS